MKKMKSALWILSASAGVFLAACASDKPAPDTPEAKAWTPVIRSSCPGWQPLSVMPEGNPEYNALFENKPQNDVKAVQNDDTKNVSSEQKAVPETSQTNDVKAVQNSDTKNVSAEQKAVPETSQTNDVKAVQNDDTKNVSSEQKAVPETSQTNDVKAVQNDDTKNVSAEQKAAPETSQTNDVKAVQNSDTKNVSSEQKTVPETSQTNDVKAVQNDDTKNVDKTVSAVDTSCSGIANPEDEGIPAFVHICIECSDGVNDKYYVNGKECPDISGFISSFAEKTKGSDPIVIIYAADANVTNEKADIFIENCAKAGLKRYHFMSYRELGLSGKTVKKHDNEKPTTKKRFRVDESKPAEKYIVLEGDTLSSVAGKKYGNANLWNILFQKNRAVLKNNPDIIKPGVELLIPAIITEEK